MENILAKLREVMTEAEIVNTIVEMIKIPSYPGIEGQETKTAMYIHKFFKKENIPSEIYEVVDGRCNVVAKLKGKGTGKSILLTGHLDTVPLYDMEDGLNPRVESGKIIGRGSVDMKGPLACMMLSMAALKRAGMELDGDVVFAGVIDEENKSEGTIELLKRGLNVQAAVVGEASELNICVGHRGLEWFEFFFQGKTVHGGKQEEGINAIKNAMTFIKALEEELIPKLKVNYHPIIGTSSMNYGYIKGGLQPSTVAGECLLQIDRRWIPGEKYENILKQYRDIIDKLEKEDEKFKCKMKVMDVSLMRDGYVHEAMETDKNHTFVKIVSEIVHLITGNIPKRTGFTAWSDGGLLNSYGNIPTVIFAPGCIESAHSNREYIDIESLLPAVFSYALICHKFCK